MNTFVLVMVRQPDIYKRLQEEMDRVVGSERLPDFDDREGLPYLNAVIKELYRYVSASASVVFVLRAKLILMTTFSVFVGRWQVPVPLGSSH